MAAPAPPANFFVQQGNGQVLLSWDISAGATSYAIARSLDNVAFANLASVSSNSYLDAAVTSGTQYFYNVASIGAGGTSASTEAQGTIPVTAGQASLAAIRLQSQQTADMVNSQFLRKPEWNTFINLAADELYDLLVTVYEDYYVAAPYQIATDGSSQQYPLPATFYKLLGVDLALNASANSWLTLRKFNFIDRNKFAYPTRAQGAYGAADCRYRVVGSTLYFETAPATAQPIRLWYIPRRIQLLADTDMLDGVNGWARYVIVRTAIYALVKEESDTSALTAELMYLKQRIEESAQNRDAGAPDTISDTRRSGGYGNGDGFGGY